MTDDEIKECAERLREDKNVSAVEHTGSVPDFLESLVTSGTDDSHMLVPDKSDLTGLAQHTYTSSPKPCWDDFKQWDDCVSEEAAQRLETPVDAIYDLEEAYRDLESLDNLIENMGEELSEGGFDYEFGRIEYDITRLYHHLERALNLLKQNEIDFRLPDLLRKGCKNSGLVANPYPQHMHVKADERQIKEDLRRLGFLVGDPGRSDEDDQELHAIRARLRAQGRDPGWDPVERTC